MACWLQLPTDLVVNIVERLNTLEDRLYFQAVCMPWRRALKERLSLLHCSRLPWLLLSYCELGKEDQQGSNAISCYPKNAKCCRSCFNVSESKVYHFEFPEAYGKHCCGSSYGWLTMVDNDSPSMFLLNPLTRSRIDLPPITTFPDIVAYRPDEVDGEYLIGNHIGYVYPHSSKLIARTYIAKVTLSTDPAIPGCIVVVICGNDRHLVFCSPGDRQWTEIGQAYIYDVVFWRNQLYAVDWCGSLVACAIGVPSPKETLVIDIGISSNISLAKAFISHGRKYLVVDSFGELLMVVKVSGSRTNHIHPDLDHLYKTSRFYVYRMDQETKSWKKVDDLGDYLLFLGVNSAELFLAHDFPQCKSNSIYFTDDYADRHSEGKFGGHDLGIFSLKDGTVEPFSCCREDSLLICPSPVWFTPSLRRR